MSTTQNSTVGPDGATINTGNQDWFTIACRILAPGTTHHETGVVASSWDAYDKLELHGWKEKRWWVTEAGGRPVARDTPGAKMHEHREKLLPDGSKAVCYRPPAERPVMRLCLHCVGRGWTTVEDEDGETHPVDCEWCDAGGYVPRPFSPLTAAVDSLTLEDFGVRP